MIDWDAPDPEPDFTPPQNQVELRTLEDAVKLLDQWIEAYEELRRDYTQLHSKYVEVLFMAGVHTTFADNYELLYRAALDPANDDLRDTLSQSLRQE